jgi:hypothetical protein
VQTEVPLKHSQGLATCPVYTLQSCFSNVCCNTVPPVCALVFQVVSLHQAFPPKSCTYFCSPPSHSRRRLSPFHMKNRPTVLYRKDGGSCLLWNVSKVMLNHVLTQSTTVSSDCRDWRRVVLIGCSDGSETLKFLTRVWAKLKYAYRQEDPPHRLGWRRR